MYGITRPWRWRPFPTSFKNKNYLNDMRFKYGLKDYNAVKVIYDNSFGLCICCEIQLDYDVDVPDLHHNHDTGEVCGFTCRRCNNMIAGALEDKNVSYVMIEIYIRKTLRSCLFTDAPELLSHSERNTTPDLDFSYILTDEFFPWKNLNKSTIGIYLRKEKLEGWKAWRKGTAGQKYWHKYKYNLTENQYYDLFKRQKFRCACCRKRVLPYTRNAHVDHCKETNTNLGILCGQCNPIRLPLYEAGLGPRGKEILRIE